jgi:hypothetical protein
MKKLFSTLLIMFSVILNSCAGDHNAVDKEPKQIKTGRPLLLRSEFKHGERIYLKLATVTGDSIRAFCDTGGGISMIFPPVIRRLKLESKVKTGFIKYIMPMKYIAYEDVIRDPNIPPLSLPRHFFIARYLKKVEEPVFFVPDEDGETKEILQIMPEVDAFLAQNFFMDKAWTFDYLNQQLWVNTPLSLKDTLSPNVQKLGFKKDENGLKKFGHPSMQIEVDGEVIDVLFDTGATSVLSENGRKQLGTTDLTIGSSFIARSVFDNWRQKHPEWRYIEKGEFSSDIIEVPRVKIGGHLVGPVLFAKRKDEVWSEGMINSMDKVVKGAIGGSGLKYFKVTADYNSELIKFDRK